jgi:hypothetical protein
MFTHSFDIGEVDDDVVDGRGGSRVFDAPANRARSAIMEIPSESWCISCNERFPDSLVFEFGIGNSSRSFGQSLNDI